MYEIIIIICLAVILGILFRKWPETESLDQRPAILGSSPLPLLSPRFEERKARLFEQAERYFQEQNWPKAEPLYLKAATSSPSDSKIYGRLGVIYFNQKNLKDAREALKMAIKLDSENGFYQNNLGLVLYNLGRYKEALLYFENAVDLDDKMGKRWVNLGLCYEKIGELKKATEACQKALKLEPKNKRYKELLERVEKELKKEKR